VTEPLSPSSPAPLFSVIVPTRDRPDELCRCLERLAGLAPCPGGFEVLVVDDGSARPVEPRLEGFGRRFELTVLRQESSGPAAARNHAAERARGRWLAFLDDDCLADPDWLAELAAAAGRHGPGHLLGGTTANGCPDNACSTFSELILEVLLDSAQPVPGGSCFFRTANLAVEREAFRASGGFDPAFRTSEDREFCDRWLHAGGALSLVPGARVEHRKPLDLAAFVRQHVAYGRGARRFHRLRRERGSGRLRVGEGGFYARVLGRCFRAPGRMRLLLPPLFVVWQLSNLAGFLLEAAEPAPRRLPPS
jgi:GT2 family glycosyltransferase